MNSCKNYQLTDGRTDTQLQNDVVVIRMYQYAGKMLNLVYADFLLRG